MDCASPYACATKKVIFADIYGSHAGTQNSLWIRRALCGYSLLFYGYVGLLVHVKGSFADTHGYVGLFVHVKGSFADTHD